METLTGNHYTDIHLSEYLKTYNIANLESMGVRETLQVFCATCDDFFAHKISIAAFSVISETLFCATLDKDYGELSGAIHLAQDLSYQYKHNRSYFFVHLRTIMAFYLKSKSEKNS